LTWLTPNKTVAVFAFIGGAAFVLSFFYDYNSIKPLINGLFEFAVGVIVSAWWMQQPKFKRWFLPAIFASFSMTFLTVNLFHAVIETGIEVAQPGAKDHVTAEAIKLIWRLYETFLIIANGFFCMAFFFIFFAKSYIEHKTLTRQY